MLNDAVYSHIYIAAGYTDYPRRIIIREDFTQHSCFSVLNNSSQITIVHLSLLYKLQ